MTLTSRLGLFVFPKGTPLVDAKALRDTVLGRWFAPKQHETRLRSHEDIRRYLKTWENRAKIIPFELVLNTR